MTTVALDRRLDCLLQTHCRASLVEGTELTIAQDGVIAIATELCAGRHNVPKLLKRSELLHLCVGCELFDVRVVAAVLSWLPSAFQHYY
jgi:hypothetical protein